MITHPGVKLNLGLNVLRRRDDGYHDIETLFVPCDAFHDTLEIISGDDWSRTLGEIISGEGVPFENVGCADPSLCKQWAPPSYVAEGGTIFKGDTLPETCADRVRQAIRDDGKVMVTIARDEGVDWDPLKDLTVKAYEALERDFSLPPVKIFLQKTSPVGAGLGGGSADAAFALRMLSQMFSLGLSDEALAAYASGLGSDCAFFVYNRPMIGSARGEVLEPYELDLGGFDVRVVIPEGVAVSTADAYRGIVPREPDVPLREALSKPIEQWRECLVNDFETTVFAKYPAIAEAKRGLYDEGAVYASMSGSGSALFGIFKKTT